MDKNQAIQEIAQGKHRRFAYKKAVFADIPEASQMEDSWFDLSDGDYHAKVEDAVLYLDLWFRAGIVVVSLPAGQTVPEAAILNQKTLDTPQGKATWIKVRIAVAEKDMDYIYVDSKRIYL